MPAGDAFHFVGSILNGLIDILIVFFLKDLLELGSLTIFGQFEYPMVKFLVTETVVMVMQVGIHHVGIAKPCVEKQFLVIFVAEDRQLRNILAVAQFNKLIPKSLIGISSVCRRRAICITAGKQFVAKTN